jgi:hypothetical protein
MVITNADMVSDGGTSSVERGGRGRSGSVNNSVFSAPMRSRRINKLHMVRQNHNFKVKKVSGNIHSMREQQARDSDVESVGNLSAAPILGIN